MKCYLNEQLLVDCFLVCNESSKHQCYFGLVSKEERNKKGVCHARVIY